MKIQNGSSRAYRIFSIVVLVILAFLFLFPLYWIVTGAFKNGADINNPQPVWFPTEWVSTNFEKLFAKRSAPLFSVGDAIVGPTVPAAIRWLVNTVFMSVMAMLLTCLTAAMAGYSLAKKRFAGRGIMFSLIVCAMALPKQVILIPLLKEMAALDLYGTLWAVIFPTVGWPFGVFLMKQFAEGIPMIKPGIGALAIFTFINSWNDYFMQLVMLDKNEIYTISLGIATLQSETTVDTGLLMAGAALASVPIIIVFLVFQKYFTQGITMGAVKG